MKSLKTILLITMVLLSFHLKSQSIDPASEWRVNFSTWEPGYEMTVIYYRDFIDGDTIVNGVQYQKIYRSGYTYHDWTPYPYYGYFSHDLHRLIREQNRKWYVFDGNDQTDKLLYDFTLGVNDTVISACTIPMQTIIVTSIDSVMIDSHYKKRFHLNIPFGAENIIEDIGPASGLFENMFFFEWDSELVCFAKNGSSLWGASTADCDLNVGIPENKGKQHDLAVFPNPAGDYAFVAIPLEFTMSDLKLADPFGRIVLSMKTGTDPLVKIPLGSFSPGLYLVSVEKEGKRLTVKLLVQ
jgi:hypothetical protein